MTFYLFSGSIRENLLYANPNASESDMKEALEAACLDDFVRQLPQGLDTLLGERAVRLSGGQRQQVAIARTFLRDPSILILDEATAFMDIEKEQALYTALQHVMTGRTSIVIAHRLRTIKYMDRILVLENGKIVEDGTHDELLRNKGTYYLLYEYSAKIE